MTATMQPEDIAEWLRKQALLQPINVVLYPEHARIERGWTKIPAAILGGMDAYDEAVALQKLEATWNELEDHEENQVILMPTHFVNPAREAATRKVQILMKEQYEALNAFASADDDEIAAERFHELRRHWENALHELDEIMPREPQVA